MTNPDLTFQIDQPNAVSNFYTANELNTRVRIINRLNPYMSARPDAVMALAQAPLDATQLVDQAGALYGIQTADTMKSQLEGMTPAMQRGVFSQLTPAQQQSLGQSGYKMPQRDETSWYEPIANVIGDVGGFVLNGATEVGDALQIDKAFDAMIWLGDQPAHMYRSIRMMDPDSQFLALAGGIIAAGAVAVSGIATGGGSLMALGALGGGALLGGTMVAAATNPSDWANAWSGSWNGERTFDRASQQRADEILGDPRLVNMARDIAYALPANFSITKFARDMAGNREVSLEAQVHHLDKVAARLAAPGTAEFQQVMKGLVELIQLPQFQQAVGVLQNGKISIGRDIADGLQFGPGSLGHTLVSGALDAAMQFALDPLLLYGKGAKYIEYQRRGMDVLSGQGAIDRFFQIVKNNPGVQRSHQAIADAVNAGDAAMLKRTVPTMREQWDALLDFRYQLQKQAEAAGETFGGMTAEHFQQWMTSGMMFQPLMEGFGTVRGLNNGIVLSQIGVKNLAWQQIAGPLRSFTAGLTDIKMEERLIELVKSLPPETNATKYLPEFLFPSKIETAGRARLEALRMRLDNIEVHLNSLPATEREALQAQADQAGVRVEQLLDESFTSLNAEWTALAGDVSPRTVSDITAEMLTEYAFLHEDHQISRSLGRLLGGNPAGSGLGNLLTKMTTMVPAGKAIHLVGHEAPDDIMNFVELAGLTGMPQWMRKQYASMILYQPTVGMRMTAAQAFVDNMLTVGGARIIDEALADKFLGRMFQSYAAGGLDTLAINGTMSKHAVHLDDMADMVSMPNLTELRKAVKGGYIAKMIGIADLPMLEQFQTRIWKPSVLMRIGFIPRASGEEFLNYMLRGGFGSLGQELGAVSIGRVKHWEELMARQADAIERQVPFILNEADARILRQGPMPASMRWVSRQLGRYDWADPVTNLMDKWAVFYRDMLTHGAFDREISGLASRAAGRQVPLYSLADDADQAAARLQEIAQGPNMLKARWNLGGTVDSLLLGNPNSWRRMSMGGVNDDLVTAADRWYERNSRAIMGAVGATEAGPFDPTMTQQDILRMYGEPDKHGNPQWQEYHVVKGEWQLLGNGDPLFANAAHARMLKTFEDSLTRKYLAKEIALLAPPEIAPEALHAWATMEFAPHVEAYANEPVTIVKGIVEQFLNEPNYGSFQALLGSMKRSEPELAAYLDSVITPATFSYDRIVQAVVDLSAQPGKHLQYSGLIDRLEQQRMTIDWMAEQTPDVRAWATSYIRMWGDAEGAKRLTGWQETATLPAPDRIVYRMVTSPDQYEIIHTADGDILRVKAFHQNHSQGPSISTTTSTAQTASYAGRTGSLFASESQIRLQLDLDHIESLYGPVRPRDAMWANGYPTKVTERGAYNVGDSGEVQLVMSNPRVYHSLDDEQLARLIGETQLEAEETGLRIAENRAFGDQGPDYPEDLAPGELASDGERFWEDRLSELQRKITDLRGLSAIDDPIERAKAAENLLESHEMMMLQRTERADMEDFVDFPPGTWRMESRYTADGATAAEEARLTDEIAQLRSEIGTARFSATTGEMVSTGDTPEAQARLADLEAQLARVRTDGGTPQAPDEWSPARDHYENLRAQLDNATDDELVAVLLGGVDPSAGFDDTFHAVYGSRGDLMLRPGDRSPIVRPLSYHDTHGAIGWGAAEPQHFVLDPAQTAYVALRRRLGPEAANQAIIDSLRSEPDFTASMIERLSDRYAMNVAGRYDYAIDQSRLAGLSSRLQVSASRNVTTTHDEFIAMLEAEPQIIDELMYFPSWARGWDKRTFDPANLEKSLAPWESIDRMAPYAEKYGTWGEMAMPSPFHATWDDAAAVAERRIANAMQDPYYAGQLGHVQDMPATSSALSGKFENSLQHNGMVQGYAVPDAYDQLFMFDSASGAVPTYESLVARSRDKAILAGNESTVRAWLAALGRGEQPVLADRSLADELTRVVHAQFKDYDAAKIVDMPRSFLSVKREGGIFSTHRAEGSDRIALWGIDPDQPLAMRDASMQMDARIADLARRPVQYARDTLTRGNKVYRSPRMQRTVDGERESVVFRRNMHGELVPIDESSKITERGGLYFDKNGTPIDFGDDRYWVEGTDNGDGQVMWRAVGPMMEDAADELNGRPLFAPKEHIETGKWEEAPQGDIVRAYRSKVRHVVEVGADAPNLTHGKVLQAVTHNKWDDFVRWGFDKVIGPGIDALARRPMAFHFYSQRYMQNMALREWLRDKELVRAVDDMATRLLAVDEGTAGNIAQVAEYARTLGKFTTEDTTAAARWSDAHALAWLRGHKEKSLVEMLDKADARVGMEMRQGFIGEAEGKDIQFAIAKMRQRDPHELIHTMPAELIDGDFLHYVRSQLPKDALLDETLRRSKGAYIKQHPILSKITDDDWAKLNAAERNWQSVANEAADSAAVAAINDMIPFIDSHEFKTQFAEYGKGFLPFWYAEENFMKRWARTLILEGPAVIRKAQLTYMGLKTAGVVRTDPNGRDWFVYPGSNLLQEAVNKIPGLPDLPVGVMFQSPTDMMLPGINSRFGSPQFGPLVSIPIDVLTVPFPELKSMERSLLGDVSASKSALDQLVPAVVANTFNAITSDESDSRYSSAMMAAIAQMEATNDWIPDNATPGQVDDKLRQARNHARIIVLSQALGGWFAPGPVSQMNTGADASFNPIGVEDPGQKLNSMYQELIRDLGIEEGTIQYLKLVPLTDLGEMFNYTVLDDGTVEYEGSNPLAYTQSKNASVSGAPLPATEQALAFFDENSEYMEEFPNAGPWLLPMDPNATTAHSQYAYDQQTINGLRRRRSAEEFLTSIKFKEASGRYFENQQIYLDKVAQARQDNRPDLVNQYKATWEYWAETYKAAHPIFAEQLQGSAARERRANVIKEMRVVTRDPAGPQPPHFTALQQMMHDYDWYLARKAELSSDRSSQGRLAVERLKGQFESYMNEMVMTTPALQSFWTSVLRPESALD